MSNETPLTPEAAAAIIRNTPAPLQAGSRVQAPDGPGYIFSFDGDYAAVVLDKYAGRTNAPIYWARLQELTSLQAATS